MKRAFILLAFILFAGSAVYGQTRVQPTIDKLETKIQRSENNRNDLASYAKNLPNNEIERRVILDLYGINNNINDLLRGLFAILSAYNFMTCETDKTKVGELVTSQLSRFYLRFEGLINEINTLLSFTQKTVIVSLATQLKDDLREIKSALESTRL